MSDPHAKPQVRDSQTPGVELTVGPRLRPLGGLTVNRVWPTARRRLIGPFIFFDHLQRAELAPGQGLDVPPHPHIGLATVTYLFEGTILHRDSLGCVQLIVPGELNWMTAGAGIVHSERSDDAQRSARSFIHGIQSWVALPRAHETGAPSFDHYGAEALPLIERPGLRLRLIAGAAFGARASVATLSELFYVEVDGAPRARLELETGLGERGVYVVTGAIAIEGTAYGSGRLLVLAPGRDLEIELLEASKLMLFGGAPLEDERHIWWNFVSSSSARLEQAKQDWKARRFPGVPGDDGYMPAPD